MVNTGQLEKEAPMRRFLKYVLLLIKKAFFYSRVIGLKVFALLLLNSVAFCLLFLVCYLTVVYVPELTAPLNELSVIEDRVYVATITATLYAFSLFNVCLALALLYDAWGFVLNWVEVDYFDSKTARKHAAFIHRG